MERIHIPVEEFYKIISNGWTSQVANQSDSDPDIAVFQFCPSSWANYWPFLGCHFPSTLRGTQEYYELYKLVIKIKWGT